MSAKKTTIGKQIFLTLAAFWLSWFLAGSQALAYSVAVKLPGINETTSDPGKYIEYFFSFGLALGGFLAVTAMVIGGVMYMLGDSIGKVEKAKEIMGGAITGIVLLLCSYLLLATIDPTLTNLSPLDPKRFIGGIPPPPARQPQTNLITPAQMSSGCPGGRIGIVVENREACTCQYGSGTFDPVTKCCVCI